jgi:hypothetical protein
MLHPLQKFEPCDEGVMCAVHNFSKANLANECLAKAIGVQQAQETNVNLIKRLLSLTSQDQSQPRVDAGFFKREAMSTPQPRGIKPPNSKSYWPEYQPPEESFSPSPDNKR